MYNNIYVVFYMVLCDGFQNLFLSHCLGRDQICRLCRFHWRDYKCTQNCIRNPEGRRPLERLIHRFVNNIEVDLGSCIFPKIGHNSKFLRTWQLRFWFNKRPNISLISEEGFPRVHM